MNLPRRVDRRLFGSGSNLPLFPRTRGQGCGNPPFRQRCLGGARGRRSASECCADERSCAPFQSVDRLLAGAGNIFHHHDWINAKQQRKRSRQLSECFGIDLVPRRSERMGKHHQPTNEGRAAETAEPLGGEVRATERRPSDRSSATSASCLWVSKTGVSLRLIWRCRLRSLEIEIETQHWLRRGKRKCALRPSTILRI